MQPERPDKRITLADAIWMLIIAALALLYLFLTAAGTGTAQAQAPTTVAVTGHAGDASNNTFAGIDIQFQLANCGNNQPRIFGYFGIVKQVVDFIPDPATGVISGQIWPNDKINCGGTVGGTFYFVTYSYINVIQGPKQCFVVLSTQNPFNLDTAIPCTQQMGPPGPGAFQPPPPCPTGQFVNGITSPFGLICGPPFNSSACPSGQFVTGINNPFALVCAPAGGAGCSTAGIAAGNLLFPDSSGNCVGSNNMVASGPFGGANGADTLTIQTPSSSPGDDFNIELFSAVDPSHNDSFFGPHLWEMDCTNSGTTTLGCGILLNVSDIGRPSGASGGLQPLYIKMRAEQGGSHPNYVGVEIEQHSDDSLDQHLNNYVGFNIDGFSQGADTTFNAVRGYAYQPNFTHIISATDFTAFGVFSHGGQIPPSNYCDFRAQDTSGTPIVRGSLFCGPTFASSFNGPVAMPTGSTVNGSAICTSATGCGSLFATTSDVTATRSLTTVYQNAGSTPRYVSGYATISGGSGDSTITFLVGPSSPTITCDSEAFTGTISGEHVGFRCIVPAGSFYEVTGTNLISGIGKWTETQ